MSEMAIQTEQSHKAMLEKEGKYLTFALANEEYGLEILKVREIIGYMEITAVPQTPAYVKGVINLRGQVIPVVDLRAKFGMETSEITDETCIIVVETSQNNHNFSTGIVVDHVEEVLDIAGEDIEEAPQFGSAVNTDFILGMGKIGDNVKILLDIDRVLDGEDFVSYTSGQTGAPVRRGSRKENSASVKQAEPEQTQQEQPQAESAGSEQAQSEGDKGEAADGSS
jgi:purine-binding chemotaxis protein CheW